MAKKPSTQTTVDKMVPATSGDMNLGDVIKAVKGQVPPGTHTLTVVTSEVIESSTKLGLRVRFADADGRQCGMVITLKHPQTVYLIGALLGKLNIESIKGKCPKTEFGKELIGQSGQFVVTQRGQWSDPQLFDTPRAQKGEQA